MKTQTLRGIALAAIAGFSLTLRGQDATTDPSTTAPSTTAPSTTDPSTTDPSATDQSQFPTITQQPVDNATPTGSNTTFTVQATNADSIQWMINGTPIDGQTNSSLTISNVTSSDAGYYSAAVVNGTEVVPTRAASLNVVAPMDALGSGGDITVYGMPVVSGGSAGSCPGPYIGFVNYVKTISQGWGWAPLTNATVLTVTDGNSTDTIVQAVGKYGDTYCGQTSVTIPLPARSPKYRFAIYFPPDTVVPTNSYPITLEGFNQ
jgi:hypothetical protein